MSKPVFPELNVDYKMGDRLPRRQELRLFTERQLMRDYCALADYVDAMVAACNGWTTECTDASDLKYRIGEIIRHKLNATR